MHVIYVFKIATVESESSIQNNAYLSSSLVHVSHLRSCINYFRLYSDSDLWRLCILRTSGSFLCLKLIIHESTQLRCASLDNERTDSQSVLQCLPMTSNLRTTFSLLCVSGWTRRRQSPHSPSVTQTATADSCSARAS